MKLIQLAPMAALLALISVQQARSEPPVDSDVATRLAELRAVVGGMQERIATLESLVPSFAGFMPAFSERFHVMHAAGDAGDWAVADHELLEMQRLLRVSKILDPEKGRLMKAFLATNFKELKAAVQHGSQGLFRKALEATVKNCNACHAATGSPFIKVALDVPEGLSMRHPHLFASSKPLTGHAHGR